MAGNLRSFGLLSIVGLAITLSKVALMGVAVAAHVTVFGVDFLTQVFTAFFFMISLLKMGSIFARTTYTLLSGMEVK